MMKKLICLLAGMAILGGTALAEENTEAKVAKSLEKIEKQITSTKWSFKGTNVEYKLYLHDSEKETIKNGKDEDLVLKIKRKLDDKTSIYFKYDTDDDNPDEKVEFVAHKKFNEYLEAQLDLDILVADGIAIKEDNDSDKVWIKYHPNDMYTIKLAPYDIGLGVGDEFETTDEQLAPGVQMDMKISDTFKMMAGLGNEPVGDENNFGYKLGMAYQGDSTSLNAVVTGSTQKEDAGVSIYDMSANIAGEMEMGKLGLAAEIAIQDLNESIFGADETDTAVFLNASYSMGKVFGDTKLVPYLTYRMIGEYAYFDDDDYSSTIGGSGVAGHGGLNSIEVGSKFKLKGGLTLQPYFEMLSADNKIFTDTDGKAEDTKSQLVVKAKLKF